MRNQLSFIAITMLAACASESLDDPAYQEPIRFDGTVEDDGIFASEDHRDVYCSTNPESLWCSAMATASQPWVSAEYHGRKSGSGGIPCYSATGSSGDCQFPALKQMKIQFDVTGCKDAPSEGQEPPNARVDQMIAGWKDGALAWNGRVPGVTVEDGTCAWPSGCVTVTMRCQEFLNDTALAYAGLDGPFQTRVSNLPSSPAPGVRDQAKALVAMAGHINFDPHALWYLGLNCPNVVQPPNNAAIYALARQVGMHEMGHIFGFGHFNAAFTIMNPNTSCDPNAQSITAPLEDALEIFNSSSASPVISDVDLELLTPL